MKNDSGRNVIAQLRSLDNLHLNLGICNTSLTSTPFGRVQLPLPSTTIVSPFGIVTGGSYDRIENDSDLAKNEDDVESEECDDKLLKSSSEEEEFVDVYNSTDTDEDEGGYLELEEIEEENVPEIDKETHRLAIVNLDWSQILSVSVYPSEFGLKRMEEEAVKGPVGLFDDENGKNSEDESDDKDEIDNEKLRAYELSRLRYYFAVVVCDSVAAADYLYKSCDGIEF
ncbi:pre-rRNA-processing protein ESF1 [Tanacetum coccineum]